MRLTLVRHGQTAWNSQGRAQGHTDIELCVLGMAQAEALADRLAGEPIETVLSSDLTRCRQTLAPLVERTGQSVDYRPELRERSFGDWEGSDYGMLHDKLRSLGQASGEPEERIAPPNGESVSAVWSRLESVAQELQCLDGPTLVVGHGGALALLAARLLRGNIQTGRSFRFENGALTTFERRPNGFWLLTQLNDARHLDGLKR